ncbi:dihydrofolate reductase family protein [Shimazuella sp. AN120528]|uniref:dihydrofolate reductase family protein n=1 Tax=Shimazuella soli TaxID=1892854 RepID=UPI001F10162D|nr:dihydrofolate reductase family protein [Shimazuella soli]MCH5584850.1 dihydrofolate reductase family protein [Shimazuella soli]
MKRKVILYIAMSIDGHIADDEDGLDWLHTTQGEGDNGYSDFIERIDTVVMGNKTYKEIQAFDVPFPYVDKECFVFSNQETGSDEYVQYTNENVVDFIERLNQKGKKDIWIVGGGSLIKHFMQYQLIDELILTIAPVTLGKGIRLFQGESIETRYHLQCIQLVNEFDQLIISRSE